MRGVEGLEGWPACPPWVVKPEEGRRRRWGCPACVVGFEKIYRFTPFSDDAQERIRGKCSPEPVDYEVQKLPMTQLFRGPALRWPASAFQELVPNV